MLEACKLNAVREHIGDREVDVVLPAVGFMVEVMIFREDYADIVGFPCVVEYS